MDYSAYDQSFDDFQMVAYVDAAFLCLLVCRNMHSVCRRHQSTLRVYDTLLQVSEEYRHVWKSRWGIVKCLYLWTRYAAYVDTSLAVLHQARVTTLSSSTSDAIGSFNTVFAIVGIFIAEVILIIRTYALYGRSKKLLAVFLITWVVLGGVSLWSVLQGCRVRVLDTVASNSCDTNKVWIVCFTSLFASETVIVLLTLWKAFCMNGVASLKQSSELVTTFYRDGIFFYLSFLFIFIVAIALKSTIARPTLQDIAFTPFRVLHSILACRLVVHVRDVAAKDDASTGGVKSSIVFAKIEGHSQQSVV